MDVRSLNLITEATPDLWRMDKPSMFVRGGLLSAWRIIQVLKTTNADYTLTAKKISEAVKLKYQQPIGENNVRQIVQFVAKGLEGEGVAVRSHKRKGYWIDMLPK